MTHPHGGEGPSLSPSNWMCPAAGREERMLRKLCPPATGTQGQCRPEAAAAKSLQSCPTPCDIIDGSPPGSPIPGILQARTPEWVAISFSNV